MAEKLLSSVKNHLILQHDEDDDLLLGYIRAALDYAAQYQHRKYTAKSKIPPATEQAIIMLAAHFYESRDGGTAGYFFDYIGAVGNVWTTVNRLLALNKSWGV